MTEEMQGNSDAMTVGSRRAAGGALNASERAGHEDDSV